MDLRITGVRRALLVVLLSVTMCLVIMTHTVVVMVVEFPHRVQCDRLSLFARFILIQSHLATLVVLAALHMYMDIAVVRSPRSPVVLSAAIP